MERGTVLTVDTKELVLRDGYKNVSSDRYGTYGSYERTYVKIQECES